MASIEREVENALLNAISAVTGVNFYTSERGTARTLPNVVAKATIDSEELGPFTGVFTTPAILTYTARADINSRAEFDAKFQSIIAQLYRSPDLASYMTSNSNITCFVANVTGESPSVIATNRTWSNEITLDIRATAKK
jgi:phospholipid N-methyltransferase